MRTRRGRIGSNQFKRKNRDLRWLLHVFGYELFVLGLMCFTTYFQNVGEAKVYAQMPIVSPLPIEAFAKPDVVKASPQQEEIENYIRTIFGSDAKVAIAVSRNECNPANSRYPACILHTEHEYSVGIFQINLYNSRHWIHAKKVPGATMDEKTEWLKNPYNNTLIAYKIFSDSNGFQAWSAYTNSNYLKDM